RAGDADCGRDLRTRGRVGGRAGHDRRHRRRAGRRGGGRAPPDGARDVPAQDRAEAALAGGGRGGTAHARAPGDGDGRLAPGLPLRRPDVRGADGGPRYTGRTARDVQRMMQKVGQRRMTTAVLVEPGRIELREVPVPEPGPGELLVRVDAALTCGTDLK